MTRECGCGEFANRPPYGSAKRTSRSAVNLCLEALVLTSSAL